MSLGEYSDAAQLSIDKILEGDLQRLPPFLYTNGLVLEISCFADRRGFTTEKKAAILYALAPDDKMLCTVSAKYLKLHITRMRTKLQKLKRLTQREKYEENYGAVFQLIKGRTDGRNADHMPNVVVSTQDEVLDDHSSIPVATTSSNVSAQSAGHNTTPVAIKPNSQKKCKISNSERERNGLVHEISKKRRILAGLNDQIRAKKHQSGHFSLRNVVKRDKSAKKVVKNLTMFKKDLALQKSKFKNQQLKEIDLTLKIEGLQETVSELQATITGLRTQITEKEVENKELRDQILKQKRMTKVSNKKVNRLQRKLASHKDCVSKSKICDLKKELLEAKKIVQYWETEADKQRDFHSLDLLEESGYSIETRMLVSELTGLEVAQRKISPVIESVARNLFDVSLSRLPDTKTIRNINDEGHYLGKKFIAEKLKSCDSFGTGSDGTTRKKKKLLDTTLYLNPGGTVCVSFNEVANETSETLADTLKQQLTELAVISKEDDYLPDVLEKLVAHMSDRAANEKKGHRLKDEWRSDVLLTNNREDKKVHHFYCMVHVLLGMHRYVTEEINALQKTMEQEEKIGRDKALNFNWRWESLVTRVPRVASDLFGPVGDHLGLRDVWEAHCAQNALKSRIGAYKDNRFNALFETSAQLLHHLEDFINLLRYRQSNMKLKSLYEDLQDSTVITFVQAMAIIFIQISGPYWNVMESTTVPYVNLGPVIIQPLLEFVESCQEDPLPLFGNGPDCLVSYKDVKSHIYSPLLEPLYPEQSDLLDKCLRLACKGVARTIKQQLKDFLPGGEYESLATDETVESTSFHPKTNIGCEHHFGDLDSSQRRRPNCSMHHHTTVQILKRNRSQIKAWYKSKSRRDQMALWQEARKQGKELRQKHRKEEEEQRNKLYSDATKPKKTKTTRTMTPQDLDDDQPLFSPLGLELQGLLPKSPNIAVDDWVAVAYHDNWYPGIVLEVMPNKDLRVDFASRTSNCKRFKSPNGRDVQVVEVTFLLSTDCTPHPVSGGRSWEFQQCDSLDHIFHLFKEVNF